jgi:hypothetical protein
MPAESETKEQAVQIDYDNLTPEEEAEILRKQKEFALKQKKENTDVKKGGDKKVKEYGFKGWWKFTWPFFWKGSCFLKF